MYVCTCHGIRARDIDAAVRNGAKTAKAALEMCGHRPQCARCCPDIAEQIRRAKAEARATYAVAAE